MDVVDIVMFFFIEYFYCWGIVVFVIKLVGQYCCFSEVFVDYVNVVKVLLVVIGGYGYFCFCEWVVGGMMRVLLLGVVILVLYVY